MDWGSYLKPEGELILKIKCRDPEGFLNRALSRGLEFRDIIKIPSGLQARLAFSQYKAFRQLGSAGRLPL